MSAKLISEPPLLVLRSVAKEIGLNEAIVLQQMLWLSQRASEGWVEKSIAEWRAGQFPFWGARTIERVLGVLVEAGHAERREVPGKPSAYRPSPRWRDSPANVAEGVRQSGGGSLSTSRERDSEGKKKRAGRAPLSPDQEPIGFAEWLGHHVSLAEKFGVRMSVPRAATSRRSALARIFARLVGEGHELEEFRLASLGVLADEWMREHGHTAPENVLRVEKFGRRVDDGRRAVPPGQGKYDQWED